MFSSTCARFLWMFSTSRARVSFLFFFFNDTATTEIYTLSLHDALPILGLYDQRALPHHGAGRGRPRLCAGRERRRSLVLSRRPAALAAGDRTGRLRIPQDRKSTRLNSSHT